MVAWAAAVTRPWDKGRALKWGVWLGPCYQGALIRPCNACFSATTWDNKPMSYKPVWQWPLPQQWNQFSQTCSSPPKSSPNFKSQGVVSLALYHSENFLENDEICPYWVAVGKENPSVAIRVHNGGWSERYVVGSLNPHKPALLGIPVLWSLEKPVGS